MQVEIIEDIDLIKNLLGAIYGSFEKAEKSVRPRNGQQCLALTPVTDDFAGEWLMIERNLDNSKGFPAWRIHFLSDCTEAAVFKYQKDYMQGTCKQISPLRVEFTGELTENPENN